MKLELHEMKHVSHDFSGHIKNKAELKAVEFQVNKPLQCPVLLRCSCTCQCHAGWGIPCEILAAKLRSPNWACISHRAEQSYCSKCPAFKARERRSWHDIMTFTKIACSRCLTSEEIPCRLFHLFSFINRVWNWSITKKKVLHKAMNSSSLGELLVFSRLEPTLFSILGI